MDRLKHVPKAELTVSSSQPDGNFLSGDESDSSYVTAFEEPQNILVHTKSDASGDVSLEESFVVSEETSFCGDCRIDAKTQTSNCQFCRFIFGKQNSEVSVPRESISYDADTETSSTSSLTAVTPSIEESDIGSTIIDDDKNKRTEFLVSETFCKDNIMSTVTVGEPSGKPAEGKKIFINRNIDSVARIIVAESVGAAKMDKEPESEDVYHDASAEDVAWRKESNDHNIKITNKESNSSGGSSYKVREHPSQITESPCVSRSSSASTREADICRMSGGINDPTLIDHAIWTVENLHEMWSQGRLCDVLLLTSSGKEFAAHKVILSLHSGFFHELIQNSGSNSDLRIALSDSIRDNTIGIILRFMYTSLVQINKDTISDLLHASVQLSIHRLTRLCMRFINHMTIENCLTILAIVEKNALSDHITRTKNFIYEHFINVSTTEAFLNAPMTGVIDILKEDVLNVKSEVDVFLAAKRWCQRNQDADMKSAASVMKTIRFELLSAEELASYVESVEWLMTIPEVRVRVLEAYRYLSLASSEEQKLRPPSPRRRTSMIKASAVFKHAQRSQRDPSKQEDSNVKNGKLSNEVHNEQPCPVSDDQRSMHDISKDPISKHDVGTDPKSRHDISTSVSGKFFSSDFDSTQPRHAREISREKEASVLILRDPVKRSSSKSLRKHRSASNGELTDVEKTSRDFFCTEALKDSPHLRNGRVTNCAQSDAHATHAESKTTTMVLKQKPSQTNQTSKKTSKESIFPGLKKPLSDYRITTANPNALKRGPQAWPKPKNIIPTGAEDDVSDLIVISGGVSTKGDVDLPGKVIEIYDPQRDQWRESLEAPIARNHHVVVFLQDSLYLIGGSDPHSDGSEFIKPVKMVYRYDMRLNKWTETSPMSCARIFHQASALLGQLYVVGGQDHRGRILDSVETYAPVSDSWRKVAPISSPRYAVAMATYGQRLWVAGGYCEKTGSEMVDTVECFNPYTEEWTTVKSLRSARCHANLLVARGHLYLVGGYVTGYHGVDKHSTIDVYDETEKRWQHVTDMEHGRHDGNTVAWHDNIYVFGTRSEDDQERPLTKVDYFDTSENKWRRQATNLSRARFGHTCCIVPARSATNWL